jgi:hypothetical protein
MSDPLIAASVSGSVALIVAAIGALLTWLGIRREHQKWLMDIKVTWTVELLKARMSSYPEALRALALLSQYDRSAVTPQVARQVADKINSWIYSAGGLFADQSTRGAIIELRERCRAWSDAGGTPPDDLYTFRNLSILLLRRDLDLEGLQSADFEEDLSMLVRMRADLIKHGLSRR